MKAFTELTTEEKRNAQSEKITQAIILQCALDGVPNPQKPQLKELKALPCGNGLGKVMFQPRFSEDYDNYSIPLFFETAEAAIDFIKNTLTIAVYAKESYNANKQYVKKQVDKITAVAKTIYSHDVEAKNETRELIASSNSILSNANTEAIEIYEKQSKEYTEHAQKYFDEWDACVSEYYRISSLVSEWKKLLEMCDNNESIAERFMLKAHFGLANLEEIKKLAGESK